MNLKQPVSKDQCAVRVLRRALRVLKLPSPVVSITPKPEHWAVFFVSVDTAPRVEHFPMFLVSRDTGNCCVVASDFQNAPFQRSFRETIFFFLGGAYKKETET